MPDYYRKYEKYKSKYEKLKEWMMNQSGGDGCKLNKETNRCIKHKGKSTKDCEFNNTSKRCKRKTSKSKTRSSEKKLGVKKTKKSTEKKLGKKTKKNGTPERLSAGYYYRKYGPDSEGDVCDIRQNGELKRLQVDKNGRAFWGKIVDEDPYCREKI